MTVASQLYEIPAIDHSEGKHRLHSYFVLISDLKPLLSKLYFVI